MLPLSLPSRVKFKSDGAINMNIEARRDIWPSTKLTHLSELKGLRAFNFEGRLSLQG